MELYEIEAVHAEMVARLKKDPVEIRDSLTSAQMSALSAVMHIQYGFLSGALDGLIPTVQKATEDVENKLPIETPSAEYFDQLHMVIGMSGELGELLDALKKQIIYGKKLDKKNFIEEMGDILFYARGLGASFYDTVKKDILFESLLDYGEVTLQECLDHNVRKLSDPETGRYKDGSYSDKQAQERNDKKVH